MAAETVADRGEFNLIAEMVAGLATGDGVLLGAGDDGAVLRPDGDVVVSTDTMVEGVHFRRVWSSAGDVGRKAVASAVADIEAMGAVPSAIVISLAIPPELEVAWVTEFSAGVREECRRAGTFLVGGDTTSARDITITCTVLGNLGGRAAVTRAGARPGQVLAVCGRLGWAAAGLAVLKRGFRSPRAVVVAHRIPEPPYGAGQAAARAGATAMIDVSDGLLADVGHLARGSEVTIEIDTALLDIAEPQRVVAAAIGGGDPLTFLLTGGDDHALAATFDPRVVPEGWTVIGRVLAGEPTVLVDGAPWEGPAGWQHF
jgi:thiamine-monophosphate kinase